MQLTDREAQVVRLLAQGSTPKRIAMELGISRRTVETHIRNAKRVNNVSTERLVFLALTEDLDQAA